MALKTKDDTDPQETADEGLPSASQEADSPVDESDDSAPVSNKSKEFEDEANEEAEENDIDPDRLALLSKMNKITGGKNPRYNISSNSNKMPSSYSSDDAIAQLIQKLSGSQQDALLQAQQQANSNRLNAQLGMAANQALSGVLHTNVSNAGNVAALQSADQPVKDVLTQNQAMMGNVKDIQTLSALSKAQREQDPNSPESRQAATVMKKLMPGSGIEPGVTSASMIKEVAPAIYTASMKQLTAQQNNATKASNADSKQSDKDDALQYKYLRDATSDLNKDKAYTTAKSGNDAADEADQILNTAISNPVSANSIPITMARLATHGQRINQTEITKFTGGLSVADYSKRLAQRVATGTMDTTDYNNFKGLVNTYRQSAQNQMQQHASSYANRLGRLNKKDLSTNYQDLTGLPYQQNQQNNVVSHPQDDEAVAWAKANPNDPRSQQILQKNGIQ